MLPLSPDNMPSSLPPTHPCSSSALFYILLPSTFPFCIHFFSKPRMRGGGLGETITVGSQRWLGLHLLSDMIASIGLKDEPNPCLGDKHVVQIPQRVTV